MPRHIHSYLITTLLATTLAACGGGDADPTPAAAGDSTAPLVAASDEIMLEAQPTYHRMPGLADAEGPAQGTVDTQPGDDQVDTLGLTDDNLAARRANVPQARALSIAPVTTPVVYTPAQIRAAYGMPALPAGLDDLSPQQRADLGAGQTIYIIGAYNGPSIVADLARFNTRFGLPGCTTQRIPVTTRSLPAADPAAGCTISVVHSTRGATLALAPPPYHPTWAAEYALDVQWAHATAPLARIVVIAAQNATILSMFDAIMVANKMGPGVVSMSFVVREASYANRFEPIFQFPGMTYLAAAGDRGAQANWPATSPSVVSVGGTSLRLGAASRSETAWAGTGGGFSLYHARPAYQAGLALPGATVTGPLAAVKGVPARVGVDVAFNADPRTGQFVVLTSPAGATNWYSFGGTSMGTPQWAGIVAVANARRALAGRAPLGPLPARLHALAGSGSSAGVLADIVDGRNGNCSWCVAGTGYDIPTGWGTPQVGALLALVAQD
ncbi:MAG: S53 family peptidase [Aquabacterium sp.]|nr:S53 family peptidase [Aquabacterium sp.]